MKKKMIARIAVFCAAILMTGVLAGCGSSETENGESGSNRESGQETPSVKRITLKDIEVEKYVTLGDYKGIRVEKREVIVDEDELKELMDNVYYSSFPAELGMTDRAVETGDTVNIDYVGKKDDVAFSGGTAQGAYLGIGSHTYIDGFEDGLVGVMPGETVDLNLTFPAAYGNAELAGQDVVFTVKVNYIYPGEKLDEAVKNFGIEGVTSVEELRQYVYDYLYEYAELERDSLYEQDALNAFLAVCEFQEIPQEYYDSFRETTKQNLSSVAAQYGMDVETYVYYVYAMDLNTFLNIYANDALRQNIAMQVLANQEGLAVDDEELDSILQEYATSAGYDSVEEYVGNGSREEYRDYFMYERVYDFLLETAVQSE